MSSPPVAIDVGRIVRSVLREFRVKATVSANPDQSDPTLVHLTIRYARSDKDIPVTLRCGAETTPFAVRQSLTRQLKLAT